MAAADFLGPIFGISEIALTLYKRSGQGATDADKGSLRMLWLVIAASMATGIAVSKNAHGFGFSEDTLINPLGMALFFSGLALRWCSIFYLGKYFTVNVAIADDHKLINSGPYRYIRHPSYTGALMAFAGFGLCLSNWLAFAVVLLPVSAAFLRRISIEEAALRASFGQAYEEYCRNTKRLIPSVY